MRGRAGANIRGEVAVEGLKGLLLKLERLDADVRKELKAATLAGAEVIKEPAKALAPGPHVDTEVEEATRERATVAIGPTWKKWYYRFFELGAQPHEVEGYPLVFKGDYGLIITEDVDHPGMVAQPFLRPAFDANSDLAVETVKDYLRSRIRELR